MPEHSTLEQSIKDVLAVTLELVVIFCFSRCFCCRCVCTYCLFQTWAFWFLLPLFIYVYRYRYIFFINPWLLQIINVHLHHLGCILQSQSLHLACGQKQLECMWCTRGRWNVKVALVVGETFAQRIFRWCWEFCFLFGEEKATNRMVLRCYQVCNSWIWFMPHCFKQ